MSETSNVGFPEAARRFGVPIRVLRHAIRAGKIPAPPDGTATASLPAEWLDSAQAAFDAAPNALSRAWPQKVAPFARYEGTSAWRKYTNRVREYNRFRASAKQ
jgi:hypothetical protein